MKIELSKKVNLEKNTCFYRGRSMKGTFRTGDYLNIEKIDVTDVNSGDIIVFRDLSSLEKSRPSDDGKEMVHRVIKIIHNRLITRGDNNFYVDDTQVNKDNFVGRVIKFERNGKTKLVHGGCRGLFKAKILRMLLYLQKAAKIISSPFYRMLRKSGLVKFFWHPGIRKIYFNTEKGPLVKYICGSRIAAKWWPGTGNFELKKPYNLALLDSDILSKIVKNEPGRKEEYKIGLNLNRELQAETQKVSRIINRAFEKLKIPS